MIYDLQFAGAKVQQKNEIRKKKGKKNAPGQKKKNANFLAYIKKK